MYYTWHQTPAGTYFIEATDRAILKMHKTNNDKQKLLGCVTARIQEDNHPQIILAKHWLDTYFSGENPKWELMIDLQGTAFQKRVWGLLRQIPYGQSTTYGQIAKMVASKMSKTTISSQAIGGAIARNPISIYIPCHRVLAKNGALTGYADGIMTKKFLLDLEHITYKE